MAAAYSFSDHLSNPTYPLFLHPEENPALILVTPPLSDNCLIVQMDTYQTIGVAIKYQGLFYLHSSSNNSASDSE